MLWALPVLSLSQPCKQPFLKGALLQFSAEYLEVKILVLVCVSLLGHHGAESPYQYKTRGRLRVCTCVNTHIYVFTSIFVPRFFSYILKTIKSH